MHFTDLSGPSSHHIRKIMAIAVTDNSRYGFSASQDRTVKVWDLENGHVVQTLYGHTGGVLSVLPVPNRQRVISASADHTLMLWDFITGRTIHTFRGHTDWVYTVAVTRNGKHAVSGSADRTVRVWDVERGQQQKVLPDHLDEVRKVVLTSDSSLAIATIRADEQAGASVEQGEIKIWDWKRGAVSHVLRGHVDLVTDLIVLSDNQHVISASWDGTIRIWDVIRGLEMKNIRAHKTRRDLRIVLLSNERQLVSVEERGLITIWDILSGEALYRLDSPCNHITSLATSSDSRYLIITARDGSLALWNVATRKMDFVYRASNALSACSISPNNKTLVVGDDSGQIYILQLEKA